MNEFDRHRLLSALILLTMALFVAGGTRYVAPWRRHFRLAAIVGILAAVALALGEIAFWLRNR